MLGNIEYGVWIGDDGFELRARALGDNGVADVAEAVATGSDIGSAALFYQVGVLDADCVSLVACSDLRLAIIFRGIELTEDTFEMRRPILELATRKFG